MHNLRSLIPPGRAPARAPERGGSTPTGAGGAFRNSAVSRRQRRVGAILAELLIVLAVAAGVLVLGLLLTEPAHAADSDDEDVPVISYDEEWQDWAGKWMRLATKERKRLVKITNALGLPKPRPVPKPADYILWHAGTDPDDPTVSEPYGVLSWKTYGQACKDRMRWYDRQSDRLWRRLVRPGGSGVQRWAPLLRYAGLPEAWMHRSLVIMRGESGGNRFCVYAGHYGLFQYTASWWAGKWDWRDPYRQCRAFVHAVKLGGWHHWAATDPGR